MPGAVYPFLFATSFFTFSKVMLNSLTWLTFSFKCLLISSIHGMFGVLSSLFQIPPQNSTNFPFLACLLHVPLLLPAFWRISSGLAETWYCLVSFSVFLHILSTYLFVPQLVQPLLPCISQVVISCIFLNQGSQFLNELLFLVAFLRCLLLYSSLLVFATFWRNSLFSFFNFRSRLFPFALFFFLSPWSPCTNLPCLRPIVLPIAYTLSLWNGFYFLQVYIQYSVCTFLQLINKPSLGKLFS